MQEKFNNFLNANKAFWQMFKEPESDKLLLVETNSHPAINHANAVTAKMVAAAKGFRIAWLKYDFTDEQFMKTYSANSVFVGFRKFSIFFRIYLVFISTFRYLTHVLVADGIKLFKYKNIPYGDFIYDGYLAIYSMATLHRFDLRLIRVFYIILLRDEQARELLKKHNIKGILVAHYMGMSTGMLSRVAMQKSIPVYWKGGGHEIFNFSVFKNLDQIYNYPLKPSMEEVDLLAAENKNTIEEDFKNFMTQTAERIYGTLAVAYNNNLDSSVTTEKFLKDFDLENKPIIFVMLHAFNDYPHSHFKSMLFKDYYDWFIQTYYFALKDTSKNWIFKEHPANRFYLTKDINLNKIMQRLPSHVKFVPSDSKIKASVVLNVANAIVTCLGTAGVEMPALRGIQAVIAGNTFYDKLGFTTEPKSKEEYFEILSKMELTRLSAEQQLRAKCCYLYIYKYCMVPFAAGPAITVEELSTADSKELRASYWGRILKVYNEKRDLIYSQFGEYVQEIKKENFVKIVKLPFGKSDKMSDSFLKIFSELRG